MPGAVARGSPYPEVVINALAVDHRDQERVQALPHSPKPPAHPRGPGGMARVLAGRRSAGQPGGSTAEGAWGQPGQTGTTLSPPRHAGRGRPCFDHRGVVLPYSILGNLQDFRSYLETRGEPVLVGRPAEPTGEAGSGRSFRDVGGQAHRRPEETHSHALQHWSTHMRQRRLQQDSLAKLLRRPKDGLLMNRADGFRKVQERRELLSQALPAIQPGHGYRVGSEFWSLPERLGAEESGIAFTLGRGQRGPVVRVGRPRSIRHESGNVASETCAPASKTWEQSEYLQRQQQQVQQVLKELDLDAPNMDRLEVVGSGRPITSVAAHQTPWWREVEEQEQEEARRTEEQDPGSQEEEDGGEDDEDDVDTPGLLVPALMFCGQIARWTGCSSSHQGQVGISFRMGFEVVIGSAARSHMMLRNHGNTAIQYTWQRLERPCSFAGPHRAARQTPAPHFYFNSSMGVILPGQTQQVEFMFKSDTPGVRCELWQLNTVPMLLGGAGLQVTLRGVAIDPDTNADRRLVLERELERKVLVKMCQSLVSEALRGVTTPERASSPSELYTSEDQAFLRQNPKLQYAPGPVEALRGLWQGTNPGGGWDLSVETLRQELLALPVADPGPVDPHPTMTREQGLAQLNSTLSQLPQLPLTSASITPATVGRQLWTELLDALAREASVLRHTLGLPETDTWSQPGRDPVTPDLALEEEVKPVGEKGERKGGAKEAHGAGGVRERGDGRGATKATAKERASKKERAGEEVTKAPGGRRVKEPSLADVSGGAIGHFLCDDSQQNVQPEMVFKYRTQLNQKVYVLMDHMVDSLASLLEALGDGEQEARQDTHK